MLLKFCEHYFYVFSISDDVPALDMATKNHLTQPLRYKNNLDNDIKHNELDLCRLDYIHGMVLYMLILSAYDKE